MLSMPLKAFPFPTSHKLGKLSDDAVLAIFYVGFFFFFNTYFLSPFLAFTKLKRLITSAKLYSPAN